MKLVGFILLFVFMIHLLPIKQVINYFNNEKSQIENITETESSEIKDIKPLSKESLFNLTNQSCFQFNSLNKIAFFHFSENVLDLFNVEILTPPPNI